MGTGDRTTGVPGKDLPYYWRVEVEDDAVVVYTSRIDPQPIVGRSDMMGAADDLAHREGAT